MSGREDRRAQALLACVFSLLYAYFFQGGGFNQNSHFDTIRAIVERHSLEITPFAENTGDTAVFEGRVYSNKPPGLPFWGAPPYFLIYHVERALEIRPDTPWTVTTNAHLLTFYTSGIPAVVLLLFLYLYFRREGATTSQALGLAGGFGAGSLLLPYSGLMMSHALSACLLFGAWYLISASSPPPRSLLVGGFLAGLAVLTELLAAPAVVLFGVYLLAKHRPRSVPVFLIGPTVMAGVLLLTNYFCFGNMLVTSYSIQSSKFVTEGLLFGTFDWPHPIRFYWLTVHPFRGLFLCCPIFFITVLSLVPWRSSRTINAETLVRGLVVLYFLLFNMSFNGWTGGWATGPRYLIPALPFLYSFSLPGFVRFPKVSGLLMVVSTAAMLCVTAVWVTTPAPDFGPPPNFSPVVYCARRLAAGHVSVWEESILGPPGRDLSPHGVWNSYNVGELLGLRGLLSVMPAVLLLLAFAVGRWRLRAHGHRP